LGIRLAAAGAALLLLSAGGAARRQPGGSVQDEILGIRINSDAQSAERKLDALGSRQTDAEQEESQPGHTLAWRLKGSGFQRIAIRRNANGKVLWLTGVVRRGREIPFARLGDLSMAKRATDAEAIWYVDTPDGGYRLIGRGKDGKASLVSLLSLSMYTPKM
jgi:hypothetical protein